MMVTPLAAVPLAEAGHMLRPRIIVGGATHKHGSQKAISRGPQRNSQPQRAGQKWGGLERGLLPVQGIDHGACWLHRSQGW